MCGGGAPVSLPEDVALTGGAPISLPEDVTLRPGRPVSLPEDVALVEVEQNVVGPELSLPLTLNPLQ